MRAVVFRSILVHHGAAVSFDFELYDLPPVAKETLARMALTEAEFEAAAADVRRRTAEAQREAGRNIDRLVSERASMLAAQASMAHEPTQIQTFANGAACLVEKVAPSAWFGEWIVPPPRMLGTVYSLGEFPPAPPVVFTGVVR